MDTMPRPRPPHLHRQVTRHGATVWYVRIGKGQRTRIRAAFGTPEFMAEYHAAVSGAPPKIPSRLSKASLAWLWERYQDGLAWSELSQATRRQRINVMKRILAENPDLAFADVERKHVLAGIDRRRETPAAARHFLETLRSLFRWAVNAELAAIDPTDKVKTPRNKGGGYHVWTEEECRQFEAHWQRGTWERLAFDVLLYTGLRRGDVVRVGRQHMRDGMIVLRTEKTKEVAFIPVLPQLIEALAAGPCGDLTFIAGEKGGNLTKETFGNMFRRACQAAGVPGSAHGLRKVLSNRFAHIATEAELEAMFGWERGSRVTPIYTNQVSRERLAKSLIEKLTVNDLFPHRVAGEGSKGKNNGKSTSKK